MLGAKGNLFVSPLLKLYHHSYWANRFSACNLDA
jgi:hypothetical protein